MKTSTRKLLNEADQTLILDTERRQLDELDEDELIDLHARVRRARNKYTKLYRRQASAQVVADSGRGAASKKNQRTRAKAEVFEDALATVSRRLARVARASAAELKAERLAAARGRTPKRARSGRRSSGGSKAGRPGADPRSRRGDAQLRSPAKERATASTRARGKRKQAARDARR